MPAIDSLQAEYLKLRGKGLDPKTALAQLRADIVLLDVSEREKLLEQLRMWEISNAANAKPKSNAAPPPKLAPIKPLATIQIPKISDTPDLAPESANTTKGDALAPTPAQPAKVNCPHCGKLNDLSDVFCYSCGQLLSMERGIFDTRHFSDELDDESSDESFGSDATLVMVVKDTQDHYRLRPQEKRHEIVVGRGSGGTMKPDVDLTPHKADELGVSRMHASISFNEKHRSLSIMDMDSANGTFINGQRLHPEEKRVLKHGDELRLGKLALLVYFYRPKASTP